MNFKRQFQVIISIFKTEILEKKFKEYEQCRGEKIIMNSMNGILNYVAKYSLANDKYYITDKCFEYLTDIDLITEKGLRRGAKEKNMDSLLNIQSRLM